MRELCRAGWCFSVVDESGDFVAMMYGPVPPWYPQTAPAGEFAAMCQAVLHAEGRSDLYTDAQLVKDHFDLQRIDQLSPKRSYSGVSLSLLGDLWKIAGLHKIKAHQRQTSGIAPKTK